MPLIIDEVMRNQPREEEEGAGREGRFVLPRLMALTAGGFVIAPIEKKKEEVEIVGWQEGVDRTIAELREALLADPASLDQAVERTLSLVLIREGLDLQAPKVDLPYNAQQVPLGAQAVLDTIARVPEAEVMKPKIEGLEQDVAQHKVVKRVLRPIEQFYEIGKANESVVLNRMGGKVEGAVERARSLMDNAALRRGLKEALAVRQDPAEEAKKTRGDHKKVEAKVAAKVVAEAGVVPPVSAAEVTQTTVTTTQPRTGAGAGVVPAAKSKSKVTP